MLCMTKRKGEAQHTVQIQRIAVNTGNGQNRRLYFFFRAEVTARRERNPSFANCATYTLRYSYQYGRYIRNAFIKLNLFPSGTRRELATLFNPKFFSQKLTFQKEMKTFLGPLGGVGGAGWARRRYARNRNHSKWFTKERNRYAAFPRNVTCLSTQRLQAACPMDPLSLQ
jgi:hypothetical protein